MRNREAKNSKQRLRKDLSWMRIPFQELTELTLDVEEYSRTWMDGGTSADQTVGIGIWKELDTLYCQLYAAHGHLWHTKSEMLRILNSLSTKSQR